MEIFQRIQSGKINKFPGKCDKILKDLILKLLNPDPWKRLGYKKLNDLIYHPYFDGCFNENGKLIKKKLVKATFKIEKKEDEKQLKPIPHDLLFRIDDNNGNEQIEFDITGFTHVHQSISKISKEI